MHVLPDDLFKKSIPETERFYLSEMFRRFPMFVAETMIKYGVRLKASRPHRISPYNQEDMKLLRWGFSCSYGYLDLYVRVSPEFSDHCDLGNYRIFDRNDGLPYSLFVEMVDKYTEMARLMIPGNIQETAFGFCQSPFHEPSDLPGSLADFDILRPVGEKWFCDGCMSRINWRQGDNYLSLPSGGVKSKREAIPAGMRFAVLKRDGFACRSCGRTPREDGVRLHIDHIIPVVNGGKSTMDNLQTLCQDCNLGKSDKSVEQMEMW